MWKDGEMMQEGPATQLEYPSWNGGTSSNTLDQQTFT
jgi:hypothetical protein